MIFVPAINLFIFNFCLSGILKSIKDIVEIPAEYASLWQKIPVVGKVLSPRQPEIGLPSGFSDYREHFLNLNVLINLLLIIPALVQHRYLSLLTEFLILWNLFIFGDLLCYLLILFWSLWWSQLWWAYYIAVLVFGLLFITVHFLMIGKCMGLYDLMVNPQKVPDRKQDKKR